MARPTPLYDMMSLHVLVRTGCNLPLLPPVGIKVFSLMVIGSAGGAELWVMVLLITFQLKAVHYETRLKFKGALFILGSGLPASGAFNFCPCVFVIC